MHKRIFTIVAGVALLVCVTWVCSTLAVRFNHAASNAQGDHTEEYLLPFGDLKGKSGDVAVAKLGFVLSPDAELIETELADKFFERPEVNVFAGVTDFNWRKKWDALSAVLVEKACRDSLDSEGLSRCLDALNYGRNESTIYCSFSVPPDDADAATRARIELQNEEENARLLAEARKEPGKHSELVATIPVGAYRARCGSVPCWIVVCVWGMEAPPESIAFLGHVRVWALDPVTGTILGYVTCD